MEGREGAHTVVYCNIRVHPSPVPERCQGALPLEMQWTTPYLVPAINKSATGSSTPVVKKSLTSVNKNKKVDEK